MKVFISYHRADEKYRKGIEKMLKKFEIPYYAVPKNLNFDGKNHQHIKDTIIQNMRKCDVALCIVGKETYSRPHVDWELYEALKGDMKRRKGILAVMLEKRLDNKNNIDYETFPNRLKDNEDYVVLEQYCSLTDTLCKALQQAFGNSKNKTIQINNSRPPLSLRKGKYYDTN